MPMSVTGAQQLLAASKFSPERVVSQFDGGAFYDFTARTGFSNFEGTATSDADAGALWLDQSRNAALGPDLVDTANTAAAWTVFGTNTIVDDGDEVRISYVDNGNGGAVELSAAGGLSSNLTAGKLYRIDFLARTTAFTSLTVLVDQATTTASKNLVSQSLTPVTFYVVADGAGERLRFSGLNGTEEVWISEITVQEVIGNHAYQSTPGSRGVLQTDASGKQHLLLDGTDDHLIISNSAIDYTGSVSIWVAYAPDVANSESTPAIVGGTSYEGISAYLAPTGLPSIRLTEAGTASAANLSYSTPVTDNVPTVGGHEFNDVAGNRTVRIAGVDVVSASIPYADLDQPTSVTIGGIGASNNLAGKIYAVAIINGVLTESQKRQMDLWFALRCGDTDMALTSAEHLLNYFAADTANSFVEDFESYDTTAELEAAGWVLLTNGTSTATLDTTGASNSLALTSNGDGSVYGTKKYPVVPGRQYTLEVSEVNGTTSASINIGTAPNGFDVGFIIVSPNTTDSTTFTAPTEGFIYITAIRVNVGTIKVDDITLTGVATKGADWDMTDFSNMAAGVGTTASMGVVASNSVQVILDKSRSGTNIVGTFNAAAFTQFTGSPTITDNADGSVTFTHSGSGSGEIIGLASEPGNSYENEVFRVTAVVDSVTIANQIRVGPTTLANFGFQLVTNTGLVDFAAKPNSAAAINAIRLGAAGDSVTLSSLSIEQYTTSYPLLQDTPGSRTVAANDADGNSMSYDAIDDHYVALDPNNDLAIVGDLYVAVIAKHNNLTGFQTYIANGDTSTIRDKPYEVIPQIGNNRLVQADTVGNEAVTTAGAPIPVLTTVLSEVIRNGADVDFWFNSFGNQKATFATITTPTVGTVAPKTSVGARTAAGNDVFLDGNLQTVLIGNRRPTINEQVRIRAALQARTNADVT